MIHLNGEIMKVTASPRPQQYSHPVSQLLAIGDVRGQREWLDYPATYGLTLDHVPDLIRMMQDEGLNWANSESDEVWAPIHAWRTLGQLRAKSAIDAFIENLPNIDNYDNDWEQEDYPIVLAMIGPAAIPALTAYLANGENGIWSRIAAADALGKIGQRYPAARDECVAILTTQLEQHKQQDKSLNAIIILNLRNLDALESIPAIEAAFKADKVDLSLQGDWEEVQIKMGLLDERITPKPEYGWIDPEYIPLAKQTRELFDRLGIEKPDDPFKDVGRNEPCPCGSGKKFKKCHGHPARKR